MCSKEAGPCSIWRALCDKPSLDLAPHLQYSIKGFIGRVCGYAAWLFSVLNGKDAEPSPVFQFFKVVGLEDIGEEFMVKGKTLDIGSTMYDDNHGFLCIRRSYQRWKRCPHRDF